MATLGGPESGLSAKWRVANEALKPCVFFSAQYRSMKALPDRKGQIGLEAKHVVHG